MQRDWRGAPRSIACETRATGSVMAKPSPEAAAQSAVLQPHVDAGMLIVSRRGQMRSTSTFVPSRGLERRVEALDTRSRDGRDIGFSSPPLSKGGHLALGCLRGTDLGKIDRGL